MLFIKKLFNTLAIIIVGSLLSACGTANEATPIPTEKTHASDLLQLTLDVYKSPTCGCCNKWITHLHENEFETTSHHPDDLSSIKTQYGIQNHYQSCHTAVSKEGYVFEGHIPAKLIKQFLADTPENSIGLAVPGMPLGSPGMEVGDQFRAYEVLLLHADGSSSVYAELTHLSEQY